MENARRSFLSSVIAALIARKSLFSQAMPRPPLNGTPQFPDPGDASGDRRNSPPFAPEPDPKWQLKENQKNLRRDADHLLALAKALKEDADNTEQVNVLSLSLVRKAEEIEKLAKQIKGLARAA